MMGAARRSVVLADHTKVGNDHFARFARLEDVDVLVTDTGLDDETAAQLAALGPRVVRA
jgi:DeoR family fructose operon transcriptional repressor